QPLCPAAVGVHDVDLEGRRSAAPVTRAVFLSSGPALECDLLPVGRPGGSEVAAPVSRQPALSADVGVHDVDLRVAIAAAHERNLVANWRPRMFAAPSLARQPPLLAPVRVYGVDLELTPVANAGEGELLSVRRPGHTAFPAGV